MKKLTNATGAPVVDNLNIQTAALVGRHFYKTSGCWKNSPTSTAN